MKKKRYFIVGAGRCGTSMLAAIVAEAGANFGSVRSKDSSRTKGYFESEQLFKAHQWFNHARNLKRLALPYPHLLHRFFKYRGQTCLKNVLNSSEWCKVPHFHQHIHEVKQLDYEPIIIGVWRDFLPNAASYHKKNGTTYSQELQRWTETNYHLLFLLRMYPGCLIKFDEIVDGSSHHWAHKIADVSNVKVKDLLAGQKKITDGRSHNEDIAHNQLDLLPEKFTQLHTLLESATVKK